MISRQTNKPISVEFVGGSLDGSHATLTVKQGTLYLHAIPDAVCSPQSFSEDPVEVEPSGLIHEEYLITHHITRGWLALYQGWRYV